MKLDHSKDMKSLSPNQKAKASGTRGGPHVPEIHLDRNKRHVFVAKATSPEQNLTRPGLQVCRSQLSLQAFLRI